MGCDTTAGTLWLKLAFASISRPPDYGMGDAARVAQAVRRHRRATVTGIGNRGGAR